MISARGAYLLELLLDMQVKKITVTTNKPNFQNNHLNSEIGFGKANATENPV